MQGHYYKTWITFYDEEDCLFWISRRIMLWSFIAIRGGAIHIDIKESGSSTPLQVVLSLDLAQILIHFRLRIPRADSTHPCMCAKCQAFRGSIALMPPTQCSVTALWHDDRSLCRVKCPECSGRGGSGQTLLVLYRNDRQNFGRVSRIPQRKASLELYFHQTLE